MDRRRRLALEKTLERVNADLRTHERRLDVLIADLKTRREFQDGLDADLRTLEGRLETDDADLSTLSSLYFTYLAAEIAGLCYKSLACSRSRRTRIRSYRFSHFWGDERMISASQELGCSQRDTCRMLERLYSARKGLAKPRAFSRLAFSTFESMERHAYKYTAEMRRDRELRRIYHDEYLVIGSFQELARIFHLRNML